MTRKMPDNKLTRAFTACRGKKGCEYASCLKEQIGKAPKWASKKCDL